MVLWNFQQSEFGLDNLKPVLSNFTGISVISHAQISKTDWKIGTNMWNNSVSNMKPIDKINKLLFISKWEENYKNKSWIMLWMMIKIIKK